MLRAKGKVEMTNDRTSPFPFLLPHCFVLCTSSLVLGTMNPVASELALSEVEGPALSEVEGTEARKRNIFAETTILYACSTAQGKP